MITVLINWIYIAITTYLSGNACMRLLERLFRKEGKKIANELGSCFGEKNKGLICVLILGTAAYALATSGAPKLIDTDWYHAQTIRWIEEYGCVTGLFFFILTEWMILIETEEKEDFPYAFLCIFGVFATVVKTSAVIGYLLVLYDSAGEILLGLPSVPTGGYPSDLYGKMPR